MNYRVPALLAAAVLSGCTGGGSTTATPCPAIASVLDVGAKLVSPADGATGVSTSVGTVTFTVTVPTLHQGTFTLTATTTGSIAVSEPFTTDANGAGSVTVPALQPGTAYQATVHASPVIPGSSCHGEVDGILGKFTTQ